MGSATEELEQGPERQPFDPAEAGLRALSESRYSLAGRAEGLDGREAVM